MFNGMILYKEIATNDPTTKSNWSKGTQGFPEGMLICLLKKLSTISPAIAPAPNKVPIINQLL